MSLDVNKATNSILHIAKEMEGFETFGAIVLNKVLYYADHTHYRNTGHTITGFRYVKRKFGPTPAAEEFMPIREDLLENRAAREVIVDRFGRRQKRLEAIVDANCICFDHDELEALNNTVSMFRNVGAMEASELSHNLEIGWQLAEDGEEIPPCTFLLALDDVTDHDIANAKKAFAEFCNASGNN